MLKCSVQYSASSGISATCVWSVTPCLSASSTHPRISSGVREGAAQYFLGLRQIPGKNVGKTEIGQDRGLLGRDLQRAGVITTRFVVPAQLIERGSLHRKDSPIGIIGRMGAGENIERLLEIAVVGKRPAISGEQWLVAGMGDGGLFEHGDGLGALPWRAAPGHT
jgi:hypothetical protein